MSVLSGMLPLGGRTTGVISDMYYTAITPAGYAFSKWSVIYVLLLFFVIYQLRRDSGNRDSVKSIGPWFILSCIFNMAWLVIWHYLHIEWSVVVMLLLLLTLWVLYVRTHAIDYPTPGERFCLKLPCALPLSSMSGSCSRRMTGASLLAILIGLRYRDSIVPLIFTWAYIGSFFRIFIKRI
ncbi:tryptophan-rich sensory protein [Paenibacillus cisolokensis]|uniref:tryptophan-rich sensory protein n=1 Tax=Paenibacillus cisolokensis TaxID=1658519 RepID=UPI003D27B472